MAELEHAWAERSRFERVGHTKFLRKSPIFFANSQKFFHMFLRPQCTFGTKNTKTTNTRTPSKMVLFQKTWRKSVKEHSFNHRTERAIVEDCVTVILPPQQTLYHLFWNFGKCIRKSSLLSKISNSKDWRLYWSSKGPLFDAWNARALTHVPLI